MFHFEEILLSGGFILALMIPRHVARHMFHVERGLQLAVVVVVCNAGKTLDLVPYLVWKRGSLLFNGTI